MKDKQSPGAACESRGGRPGLPSEFRSCVKVEVAVLGFPSQ